MIQLRQRKLLPLLFLMGACSKKGETIDPLTEKPLDRPPTAEVAPAAVPVNVPAATLPDPVTATSMKVMFWNAENLYDLVDDPQTSDENWLPGGREQWSETLIDDKIRNMSEVIRQEKPDVLGLVEVESQAVVDRLMKEGMQIVEFPTFPHSIVDHRGDARGIRNAFISRYRAVNRQSHQVWRDDWINEQGKREVTRDILEVTVDTGRDGAAKFVTFLVNHWPSRSGGAIRVGWRTQAAQVMAARTAEILREHPERIVISMGDYNDEIQDRPFQDGLSLLPANVYRAPLGVLQFLAPDLELASLPRADQGTYYYHSAREWNILDHMLIAEGEDVKAGRVKNFEYVRGSYRVVKSRFENAAGVPYNCSIIDRREEGDSTHCNRGASDHRAIVATFDL